MHPRLDPKLIASLVEYSRNLHVGDLVHVEANEAIPADMVLLLSASEEGIAYIETSQLDGCAVNALAASSGLMRPPGSLTVRPT